MSLESGNNVGRIAGLEPTPAETDGAVSPGAIQAELTARKRQARYAMPWLDGVARELPESIPPEDAATHEDVGDITDWVAEMAARVPSEVYALLDPPTTEGIQAPHTAADSTLFAKPRALGNAHDNRIRPTGAGPTSWKKQDNTTSTKKLVVPDDDGPGEE